MTDAYETGAIYSTTLPAGLRSYYEQVLLDTLRMRSILVPFTVVKEDFAARDTGVIIYTEVLDTEPNWAALSENTLWLKGAHIDSRSVQIQLEIHGDVIKLSDYSELKNFWNSGDLTSLCKGKLGQSQVDMLDIMARNAFLTSPYKTYAGSKTSRYGLLQTDVYDADLNEIIRVHLEEKEVPGVADPGDGNSNVIVCATTPRVCHDIRNASGSDWLEVQEYAGAVRKFNSEVGMWGGVRFVKTMRNRLANYGKVTAQSALSAATICGQGAKETVDTVYTVGQAGSTRYVSVDASTNFAVGDIVTIHDATNSGNDGAGGYPPIEADGTQETRKVVGKDEGGANRLSFDKPLMKEHAIDAWVTKGVTVHAGMFMGGPAVVYGVGERPTPYVLPKIDDLQMIQRFSWRGFIKFQMFRPEFLEVVESGGSTT